MIAALRKISTVFYSTAPNLPSTAKGIVTSRGWRFIYDRQLITKARDKQTEFLEHRFVESNSVYECFRAQNRSDMDEYEIVLGRVVVVLKSRFVSAMDLRAQREVRGSVQEDWGVYPAECGWLSPFRVQNHWSQNAEVAS